MLESDKPAVELNRWKWFTNLFASQNEPATIATDIKTSVGPGSATVVMFIIRSMLTMLPRRN